MMDACSKAEPVHIKDVQGFCDKNDVEFLHFDGPVNSAHKAEVCVCSKCLGMQVTEATVSFWPRNN
jgi:hypothetical protein